MLDLGQFLWWSLLEPIIDILLACFDDQWSTDAFGTNNAIGSSSDRHKILGMYVSFLMDMKFASKRGTVQTVCLVSSKDIETFGLSFCLRKTISDLRNLVTDGYYDEKLKMRVQVRVIASLGLYL